MPAVPAKAFKLHLASLQPCAKVILFVRTFVARTEGRPQPASEAAKAEAERRLAETDLPIAQVRQVIAGGLRGARSGLQLAARA